MAMRGLWFLVRDAQFRRNNRPNVVIFMLILAIHLSLVFHDLTEVRTNRSLPFVLCYRCFLGPVLSRKFRTAKRDIGKSANQWETGGIAVVLSSVTRRRRTFPLEWFILEPRYNVSFSQKFAFLLTFYLRVLTRTVCEIYRERERERDSNEISRDKTWRFH